MKLLKILSLISIIVMTAFSVRASDNEAKVLNPCEFKARLATDTTAILLDVRTPGEYAQGHLQGAHLLDWLNAEQFKRDASLLPKSETIYLYCRSGRRSAEAAQYLLERGYRVVDMAGGILAWENLHLPISSSDK